MSNKELTSLSIRVFAIYALVQAVMLIAQVGTGFDGFFQSSPKWLIIIPSLAILGLIAVFYMLWKLSHSAFKKMTSVTEQKDNYKVDQVFIIQLVGFYLILVSLLDFAQGGLSLYYIYLHQASEYGSNYQPEMSSQSVLFVIGSGLKILIALTLIIKSNGWMKLFNQLRNFGLSNK